jgi:hypothetical protein
MDSNSTTKLAAITAIGGAVLMFIGATFWGVTGTDLWAALNARDLAGYLAAAGEVKTLLVANISFWIIGVLVLGVAGTLLADLCNRRRALAQAAMVCFRTAVPLAIISFIAMLALVVQLAPEASATAVAIAEVVGWIGARADDIATALLIGAGPFFISLAGRGDWLPAWLARWGMLAGFAGLLAAAVIYMPALTSFGLLIVPVGLGWMIAAGIVLLRRGRAT